jgi:hypothetical protein
MYSGGEKIEYDWTAHADYIVFNVEIHRSVAGGAFQKISDE